MYYKKLFLVFYLIVLVEVESVFLSFFLSGIMGFIFGYSSFFLYFKFFLAIMQGYVIASIAEKLSKKQIE